MTFPDWRAFITVSVTNQPIQGIGLQYQQHSEPWLKSKHWPFLNQGIIAPS
jgi:hypothetical protein